jgi:hypothetical protein
MILKYFKIKAILMLLAVSILMIFSLASCKKFIEVETPNTSFNGGNIYTTDATAIAAVTTMYTRLGEAGGTLVGTAIYSVTYHAGLSADELDLFGGNADLIGLYSNDLSVTTAPLFWNRFYEQIYRANAAIEGIDASTSLSPEVKKQLLGEAKFMRAFCYFYLVNLYGDVPLVTTTNYKQSSLMSRTQSLQVWQQIIADLVEAKDYLNPNYVEADVVTTKPNTERVRPNKWAATSLLARAYLFTSDWKNAEDEATTIINNKTMYDTVSLNNVFLKSPTVNKEAIWQIQGVTTGWNTNDARVFILPATGPNSTNPVYLNKRLVSSFEAGDKRRTNWIKGIKVGTDSFYYAYKYKSATLNSPVSEYNTPFRVAEQYLIRSEARTQQGNISGAQMDLNVIRKRAGLSNTLALTKDDMLAAILRERRSEFFCEWGHRWLDIKRANKADIIMNTETPLKRGTWQSTDKLYPISLNELTSNPNLTQTTGY